MQIPVKKLSDKAITPTKKKGDAAFDLYSIEDYTLKPFECKTFKTGIGMAIPEGFYGSIRDRSGNAANKKLHVLGGVVDSTYRGDIGVVLINLNFYAGGVEIKGGDRIAQIIIQKYDESELIEVDELDATLRAESGFGSSGD